MPSPLRHVKEKMMSDGVVMLKDSRIGVNLDGKSSDMDHVYDSF